MRYHNAVMLSVACAVVAVGCSGVTGPTSSTFLRSVNASPNGPPIDVTVFGSQIVLGLPYATATSFITIGSGGTAVTVAPIGDSAGIFSTPTKFAPNQTYTLFVVGRLTKLRPLIVTDSTSAPADSALIRLVNASPSSASVDVYVKPLGDSTPLTPTVAGVAFASASPYISTQPIPLEVVVTNAGSKTIVVDDSLMTLPAGGVRTVVVLDHVGGGPPQTALNLANAGS